MPELTVLISTFQIECIIKFIIHISLTPPTGWRKTEGKAPAVTVCCYLAFSSTQTHRKTHKHRQLCAINQPLFGIWLNWNKAGVLSTRSRQAGRLLLFCLASGRANSRPRFCIGPYVSYGARQAAVVSPQSEGLGASSAPLRCYATRAWPKPGSVGCSAVRSRCTRMRCRWGSAGVKKDEIKIKECVHFFSMIKIHKSRTCSLASSIHSLRVFLIVG